MPPTPAAPPLGHIAHYQLLRLIPGGAIGLVYEALDTHLHRLVVLKQLAKKRLTQEDIDQFMREAQALAQLDSANTVRIYDYQINNGSPYIVMELLRGRPLSQVPAPWPWPEVRQLAGELAKALAAAHRHGILHRDIKPDNIFLTDGQETRLLDFGLAGQAPQDSQTALAGQPATTRTPRLATKDFPNLLQDTPPYAPGEQPAGAEPRPRRSADAATRGALATRDQLPVGTPAYAAPELWQGAMATPQSDVYSLGAVLYELCAGSDRGPFGDRAADLASLRQQLQTNSQIPLRQFAPEVDPQFAAIIDRCVMRDAQLRYESGMALVAALDEQRRDEQARAQWQRKLRRWGQWSAAVLGIAGLTLLGRHYYQRYQDSLQVLNLNQILFSLADECRRWRQQTDRAYRLFDLGDEKQAEAGWSEALETQSLLATRYRTLEAAARALHATERLDAATRRRLLSQVLSEEIRLAEASHQPGEADTLRRELLGLDVEGTAQAELQRSVTLSIVTSPPGATVRAHRYSIQADGRYLLLPQSLACAATPASCALGPGSYRLELRAPGRLSVLYPLRIALGDTPQSMVVDLPRPEQVPPDFVYIPAGRFLYGSAAAEPYRKWHTTQPAHEVFTPGYLIGRYEVRVGEYLLFLQGLPTAEREGRRPGAPSPGAALFNSTAFVLTGITEGVWRPRLLMPQHTGADGILVGEPLHYARRQQNAQANSAQLPVVNVSCEDARAYARWLHQSGRVPGARLCNDWEWERAARGADLRVYPHGDRLLPEEANIDATYGQSQDTMGPDEVGRHPQSQSPFAVLDQVGNAAELVELVPKPDPTHCVARDGGYQQTSVTNRSDNRNLAPATWRDSTLGFRICADAPRP